MSSKSVLLQEAQDAQETIDHTKVTKGGGFLPEKGRCPARFVGYVEVGLHAQPDYQNQPKDPAQEVIITFECFGKKNMREVKDDDGKTTMVGRTIRVNTTLKLNDKAKFTKLFKAMQNGRSGIKNMAAMLGEVFMLTITHGEGKVSKKPYATFWTGSEFALSGPEVEVLDPETGDVSKVLNMTELTPPESVDLQLFIVEKPSNTQWNSIYIDGTYEKKSKNKAGEEVVEEKSKNFLQGMLQEALDWDGSAMEAILMDLPTDETEAAIDEDDSEEAPEEEVDDAAEKKAKAAEAKANKIKKAKALKAKKAKEAADKAAAEAAIEDAEEVDDEPEMTEEEADAALLEELGM
jgi:hypothetical protein